MIMKKQLLFILLLASAIVARAQQHNTKIIITGVMYDPKGYDSKPIDTPIDNITVPHKGGFEYIQFLAVETVDFSDTPYSVITCVNGGTNPPTDGWITGGTKTYKFNLTSGIVQKGSFFYVGGPEKCIAGYWGNSRTTNISETAPIEANRANWISTIAYSTHTGDDGIGSTTEGIMANGGNPTGVAIFKGTDVKTSSEPVDAVFWGTRENMTSSAINSVYSATGPLGYRIPQNDIYDPSKSLYLGTGSANAANRMIFINQAPTTPEGTLAEGLTTDQGNFLQFGGIYDDENSIWITKRLNEYRYITLADPTKNTQTQFNLSDIENGATKLKSTLPVVLTDFSAKATNNKQIKLNWSTASEKNNLRFDILKSTDGITFNKIDEIAGHGTTQAPQQYSIVDNNPAKGINYYQLRQVDTDGKISLSKIIAVKTDFATTTFAVNYTDNNITILFENAGKETPANINLTDITGRSILAFKQNITTGINNISFNIPYLASGIYVVSLVSENSKHAAKIQLR